MKRRCDQRLKATKSLKTIINAFWLCSIASMISFLTPCYAVTYNLTKIADGNTPIPGGTGGWFNTSFTAFGAPALDKDKVVFRGDGLGYQGIFLSSGNSSLVVLANTSSTIPSSASNAKFTNLYLPDVEDDFYCFLGNPEDHNQLGLYLLERHTSPFLSSSYRWHADTHTPIPSNPQTTMTFNFFTSVQGSPTLENGVVTFVGGRRDATNVTQMGVYQYHITDANGNPSDLFYWLADLSTVMPNNSTQRFDFFYSASNFGKDAAFIGTSSPQTSPLENGIYIIDPGMTAPEVVADWNISIPNPPLNESGTFKVFTDTAISDNIVAFAASGADSSGIYAKDYKTGNSVKKVFDTATLAPGTGNAFVDFGLIALDTKYHMAFVGRTMKKQNTVDALYLYSFIDETVTKIRGEGDNLFGKTISKIDFRKQGFDNGNIAFRVRFTDKTEAIYLAESMVTLLMGDAYQYGQYAEYLHVDSSSTQRTRIDLSFGSVGAGVVEPLFLAPHRPIVTAYSSYIYRDYVVEDLSVSTIVLPPNTSTSSETPVSLFLFDKKLGDYSNDPVAYLQPGDSYDLPGGIKRFRLLGLPIAGVDPDIQNGPLDFGAVGLIFDEAANSMTSVLLSTHLDPVAETMLLSNSVRILQLLVGEPIGENGYQDVNQNNKADMGDAIAILKYLGDI